MKLKQWSGVYIMIFFTSLYGSIYKSFASECESKQKQLARQFSSPSTLRGYPNSAGRAAEPTRTRTPTSPRGIRLLLKLGVHARRHNLLCLVTYAFMISRFLLTRLVSLSWLRDYHLIDCFIWGRLRLLGRMYLISPFAAAVLQSLFFFYRFQLTYLAPSKYQFQVFEFLLHDYNEVLDNEIASRAQPHWQSRHSLSSGLGPAERGSNKSRAASQASLSTRLADSPAHAGSFSEQLSSGRPGASSRDSIMGRQLAPPSLIAQRHDSIFYAPNAPNAHRDHETSPAGETLRPGWILRPNRTSASWLLMANISLCFCWTIALALVYLLLFVTFLMVPPTMTPMGFEIYYPACARWLKRHQEAELAELNQTGRLPSEGREWRLNYSSIHLAAGRQLACDRAIRDTPILQLPSDDPELLPWTAYHTWRSLFDVSLSYAFYLDFSLCFYAHFYILLMMSTDVILNALEIRRRLLKLLDELLQTRHHDHAERIENKQLYEHLEAPRELLEPASSWRRKLNQRPSPWQLHKRREHGRLNASIMSLQSLLIDHFKLVKGYNQFVSHYLLLLLVTLFAFSGAFTLLILTLKDKAIELEFLVCELLSIVFIILLFAGPCVTHILNLQLNSLISSAMALDSTNSLTKSRWIILMSHYQPTPLYCFTLFERTPVSWLFCLKLISWCFSACFVLANFLYVYKQPDQPPS